MPRGPQPRPNTGRDARSGYHGAMHDHDAMPAEAAVTPSQRRISIPGLLIATFGTLMLALAAGALWLLVCLAMPRLDPQTWPALPLALVIGTMVRGWMVQARRHAAWLAVVALLVAAAYMRVLLMASDLAGSFGMGFMQAVQHAGPSMLLHLAWLSVSPLDVMVYAVSALAAGVVACNLRPRD